MSDTAGKPEQPEQPEDRPEREPERPEMQPGLQRKTAQTEAGGENTGNEDIELMLALGRGDVSAFDVLFERWNGRVLRFLERMVSDHATAEELTQETFLRVYRARESYAAEARFSTWLYRIATNAALNELRRPRRKRAHTSRDDEDAGIELLSQGPAPDAVVHARLEVSQLERELDQLPERQRVALWLSAVEGHSYAEVAETLDATEKSVKSLVHRARVTLSNRLPLRRGAVPAHDKRSLPDDRREAPR